MSLKKTSAACHYGEHFHKSMVLKESISSVCRSHYCFLVLDPSRCVWTFSPPESEEYMSPQETSAQPFLESNENANRRCSQTNVFTASKRSARDEARR